MDIQKIPPIQQKRIITFVNSFIVDTVSFLNKFINSAENSLWKLEKRMRKLETSLKLLEMKLSSIPDTQELISGNLETSLCASAKSTEPLEINDQILSPLDVAKEDLECVESEKFEQPGPVEKVPVPLELKKYYKMMQVGVPIEGVKLKMQLEGFNPDLLKTT